jgi:uridine kinase
MIDKIVKRDGRLVAFDSRKISFAILRAAVAVGGRDQELAERIARRVVEELERRYAGSSGAGPPEGSHPTVEEVQDTVEKMLIEGGHAKTAKAYILYRYEHALKRTRKESLTYSSENIPYRKLWETLCWAVDNGCYRLADLGETVSAGRLPDLIRRSEDFYQSEIDALLGSLHERMEGLRVIIVSGPSSSGKTTTTIKIAEALEEKNYRLVPINVDNYFFDLHTHPRDPYGDYDFETPQALDIPLFNEHLEGLLRGKEVDIPRYSFKEGRREGISGTLKLEERDILLIDSLHGLYEPMTEAAAPEAKFKVYIETLAQMKDRDGRFIRWTDVRMMRRMVRDMQFRNYNPRATLLHWYLVRRSEIRYIISRLKFAGAIVNSFLPYELLFLKSRLAVLIPGFAEELRSDPERTDAYTRAERILRLFTEIPDFGDESLVPPKSLLREFVGGSQYSYH